MSDKKKRWVLGFLFNPAGDRVVLIRKTHPTWQKGKLNGIGGELKPGEDLFKAMEREFHEETGLLVPFWFHYANLDTAGGTVYCFTSFEASIDQVKSQTEEHVGIYPVDGLPSKVVPNLHWLIPMGLYFNTHNCRSKGFNIEELPQ